MLKITIMMLLLLSQVSVSTCCHTFNYTKVTVVPKVGERFETFVSGCLQRTSFNTNTTVKEIYMKNVLVPVLETDAVRHLRHITHISFDNCQIQTIKQNLFRNVPRLKFIEVKFNNGLGKISSAIFTNLEQLEILKLNNNNISTIQKNAFDNSPALQEVDCSHNSLESFTEEWFGNSTNLEVINFEFNRIKILQRRALRNFNQLKKIYFSYNFLEIIENGAFDRLTYLDYLGLRYNKLVTINPKIFPNEIKIKTLKIGSNYLNFLPQSFMMKITVEELEVWGNPWKCSCMEQVFYRLYETNASVKVLKPCKREDAPVCAYPSSYSHTCIETVDEGVTHAYLKKLKEIKPPLDRLCARLDEFVDERRKRK